MNWLKTTLQLYPEIAVFLSLAIGYWVGNKTFKGFSLGAVTATLLAAIIIGQFDITLSANVKSIFFLMFLFAVGYGIGPQFVQGIAKDGLPQALFAVISCIFSLLFPILCAKLAGYDLGAAAGFYAGTQTISASMGLATDAIGHLGLPAEQSKNMLSLMPVPYAVTYIFGTVGSAIILAQILPKLLRVDLVAACKDYTEKNRGIVQNASGEWHTHELRTYKLTGKNLAVGMTIETFEAQFPARKVFVEGLKRDGKLIDTDLNTKLSVGDIIAVGGDYDAFVKFFDHPDSFDEIEDDQLLHQPIVGLDVYVTSPVANGKTLAELGKMTSAHGVYLRKIKRGPKALEIPILPQTRLFRGDILTLSGLTKNVDNVTKLLGVADKRENTADVASWAFAIVIGALLGSLVFKIGSLPLTLSNAGGVLIAGLIFSWIRSFHPTFGWIPEPTVWFMNSVGLNVFIAAVGIGAGPFFVAGLKELGFSLFLWGVLATTLPLFCSALVGKYLFKFHPAILFGCCAGARTTTAALGMINEKAKSNIPSLGYTVTYAVGNTLLTLWGLVLIMILT